MAAIDPDVIRKDKQLVTDTGDLLLPVRRRCCSPYTAGKEHVTRKHRSKLRKIQRQAIGQVPGQSQHLPPDGPHAHEVTVTDQPCKGGADPATPSQNFSWPQRFEVSVQGLTVIVVGMRDEDAFQPGSGFADELADLRPELTRVNQHALTRHLVTENVAVGQFGLQPEVTEKHRPTLPVSAGRIQPIASALFPGKA